MVKGKNNISVPQHIAFIMDGNGRWAQKRGLPREAGHKKGAQAFIKVVEICNKLGINTVTVYAFSTENWKRPQKEVNSIMSLLDDYLDKCSGDMDKYDIKYKFIGDRSVFDEKFILKMERIEELSKNKTHTLNVALNYGGRDEIVTAANRLIESGKRRLTEDDISGALYTSHSPDPDLIIRTAGEKRLSNFMLWQAAYSELYFTDVLWPDISEHDIRLAIEDYSSRIRRYGGI